MAAPETDPGTVGARRRFRPGLWLTLCGLAGIAVLLGLGTWQLQRLDWKNDLIAERDAQLEAPPVALPADLGEPEAWIYRRVALTGRLLHAAELYQGGRTFKKRVGYHLITPLLLEDGRSILLDRGWLPPEQRDPATRPETLTEGTVTVEAVLKRVGWQGSAIFQPENDAAGNHWIWIDPPAMVAAAQGAGVTLEAPILSVYAAAVPGDPPAELPLAPEARIEVRNEHLEYALTWFSLAAALAVIYVLVGLRREEEGQSEGP